MSAFGTDPEGRNHLRRDPDGRYLLGPDVLCDWDAFRTLVARSRTTPVERQEIDLLTRAGHGPRRAVRRTSDRPVRLLAAEQVERMIRLLVVEAAHRLAVLLLDDDPTGSLGCRRGGPPARAHQPAAVA